MTAMDLDALRAVVAMATPATRAKALMLPLGTHTAPVCGARKAIEHEVAAFLSLHRIDLLTAQPNTTTTSRS